MDSLKAIFQHLWVLTMSVLAVALIFFGAAAVTPGHHKPAPSLVFGVFACLLAVMCWYVAYVRIRNAKWKTLGKAVVLLTVLGAMGIAGMLFASYITVRGWTLYQVAFSLTFLVAGLASIVRLRRRGTNGV